MNKNANQIIPKPRSKKGEIKETIMNFWVAKNKWIDSEHNINNLEESKDVQIENLMSIATDNSNRIEDFKLIADRMNVYEVRDCILKKLAASHYY